MTTLSKILAALAAGFTLVQPAIAEAGHKTVSVEFRYQDWQSPAENYQRLTRLVKNACESSGLKPMITRMSEAACSDGMIDIGVQRIGKPSVAEIHFAKTGRTAVDGVQLASAGK